MTHGNDGSSTGSICHLYVFASDYEAVGFGVETDEWESTRLAHST